MRILIAVAALLWLVSACPAQVVTEVVFRVGDNASVDWFSLNNPAVHGTLSVTNAPYASNVELNGAAVDLSRNRLVYGAPVGSAFNGYGINLTGLQLRPNVATPVSVTSLGTWDVGIAGAGYRKADGQIYYAPQGSDQLRQLNFGPTGLITGFTGVGRYNGTGTPNSVTQGDIDFAADGSAWVAGNNADSTPVVPTLWHFGFPTLNPISTLLTGQVYNGITFNAAGDTLYGYKQTTGQYGIINTTTGGFQSILDTDPAVFGVLGDLATGTGIIVVPEPSSLALVGVVAFGAAVVRRHRRRTQAIPTGGQ